MLQRYLILWLSVSSLLAYFWPRWAGVSFDPFIASKPGISWLIVAIMFSIGMLLPREEIKQVYRRWPMVLGGTTLQYLTMPFTAFVVASAFGFQGDQFVGIILVGCVPGAMASNVLTLNARGNTSYSVSLTVMATLLSPLAVPVALAATLSGGEQLRPDFAETSVKLLRTVVVPVVCGHLLSRVIHSSWEARSRAVATVVANLTILWIIAVVVGLNRERLAQLQTPLLIALLLINLVGYGVGYGGGFLLRLPERMRRALTIEIGMQNAGLGVLLATEFFPAATAIAPAMYTFGCMLTGTLLASFWSRRHPQDGDASKKSKGG